MSCRDSYRNIAGILCDHALREALDDNERKATRIKHLEQSLTLVQLRHSHREKTFGSASLENGYLNSNVVPGCDMYTVDLEQTKMQLQDVIMMQLNLARVQYISWKDSNEIAMWMEPDVNYPEINDGYDDSDNDDGSSTDRMFNILLTNNTKTIVLTARAVDWDDAAFTKLKTKILTCCGGAANYEEGMNRQSNLLRSICSGFSSEFLDKTVEVTNISFRVRPIHDLLEICANDEEHLADIDEAVRRDYRDITFNSIVALLIGCPPPDTITI